MKILVTGAAGFIGFHFSQLLCNNGYDITGIDNLNNYYDPKLKNDRLKLLLNNKNFNFLKLDLVKGNEIEKLFKLEKFDIVVNLAAQAGVRYSLVNPYAYIESNINGFLTILEACRKYPVKHLIFASSSSVYGNNKILPYSTSDNVDYPISLYAATKKSNELLAYTYSHLFKIPVTGLRFFTVYGPWGRPDMAYYSFTKSIIEENPIVVYNNGKMKRDFTYIDDIAGAMLLLLSKPPVYNEAHNAAYNLFNIGNNDPTNLMKLVRTIEKFVGKKAIIQFAPMQPGDVYSTYADIDELTAFTGFKPQTNIETGISKFVEWFISYNNLQLKIPTAPTKIKSKELSYK